jgi:hypothetical protein
MTMTCVRTPSSALPCGRRPPPLVFARLRLELCSLGNHPLVLAAELGCVAAGGGRCDAGHAAAGTATVDRGPAPALFTAATVTVYAVEGLRCENFAEVVLAFTVLVVPPGASATW